MVSDGVDPCSINLINELHKNLIYLLCVVHKKKELLTFPIQYMIIIYPLRFARSIHILISCAPVGPTYVTKDPKKDNFVSISTFEM